MRHGSALRVARQGDLGIRALLQRLLCELRHSRSTLAAHGDVGLDGGWVVHTLNGDATCTEGGDELFSQRRAHGTAHIARFGRAASEDERDARADCERSDNCEGRSLLGGCTSIGHIVGCGTAIVGGASPLLNRRRQGNGSGVDQVGECAVDLQVDGRYW